MDLLQADTINKEIRGEVILNDVSFRYASFRRIAIAGETGSGKTTLLKVIAGLVQPDAGSIFFEGKRVAGPTEKLIPGHPHIAYLSQHFELRNNYSVGEFLEMASKVGEQRARYIYALCQIDHLLARKTDQLSGGERQRTALARLLTTSPRLLLLDEPYSNLDGMHKQVLKNVIRDLAAEEDLPCMMVSHDPADVLPWAEEVLIMQEGSLVQKDIPATVYNQPANAYAGALMGEYNLIPLQIARTIFSLENMPVEKQLFVRPENIRLHAFSGAGESGTVTSVSFFGSCDEVTVLLNGTKLLARTNCGAYKKGDLVSVSVEKEKCWFV